MSKRRKYGLIWDEEGVQEEFEIALHNGATPILRESKKHSIHQNSNALTHTLIEGDNFHALTALQETHIDQVDIIYIDPPYNRGIREANDSRYNDKMIHHGHEFRHSKWISFMAKRLSLARNLLKDSGVIFISIDDNELASLKLLMDQIFGEENFKNIIIIRRGAKNVQAQFKTIDKLTSGYEYVLFYSKTPGHRFPKMVKELDKPKPGSWNNHWRGTNRPTMRYPLFGIKPETGQWRWSEQRSRTAVENYKRLLKELGRKEAEIAQAEIDAWFLEQVERSGEEPDLLRLSSTGKPEHYVPPTDTTLLNDVWFDLPPNSTSLLKSMFGKKVFDNPKPLELIKRICKFAGPDALILDFFAGSGTTLHAVLELNKEGGGKRRVILTTNNENNICTEVCYPRVKMALEGYTDPKGRHKKGFGDNLVYLHTSFINTSSKK